MKKHLIAAAAAAALAAPAMAQVTIYGIIDAGYAASDISHGTAKTKQKAIGGLDSGNGTGTLSGSRIGFRGTEDLGGGLKAGFVYETGINYSRGIAATTAPVANPANIGGNAAGFANVRQGFLELSGGFGGIRIGTQNSLAKDITEAIDPLAGVTITGAASLFQAGLITRRDTISYQTPNLSGFVARAQLYIGENTTGGTGDVPEANKGYALSAIYSAGPLRVAAILERIKNQTYAANGNRLVNTQTAPVLFFTTAAATSIDNVDYNSIGASYNFGPATVHALTSNLKLKDATAGDNGKITANLLGVTVPVGDAISIKGSFSKGKIKDATATTYDLGGRQLVAQYDLSKRTNAYFAYGQTEYDSPVVDNDVKISQWALGLRHSF
jgi:predicted porin